MNRRNFLTTIIAAVTGRNHVTKLFPEPFNWKTTPIMFNPQPQIFMSDEAKEMLFGTPYHEMNASIGPWIGLPRNFEQTGLTNE